MNRISFSDNHTINIIALDGEKFTLKPYLPVSKNQQSEISKLLLNSIDNNFSNDKTSMIYWTLMDMMSNIGFSFYLEGSDRSQERIRIGSKIRRLRENKGIDAKKLATLANIDPANLSRIEQGKYSVGLDILSRISDSLGVKIDLVEG